jgi:hypothetical protein
VGVVDRGLVDAVLAHVGEAVEQVGPRHAHAVEPEPAVVDAVEAHLEAVVLDPDARQEVAVRPDGYDEGVHAVGLATHLELGEDHRDVGVRRGVADVVLARDLVRGRDHELVGGRVVGRGGAERLHVGAVPGLGHREAAHQPAGDQVGEVGVVVALRAELEDRPAEQPELHADLHQHRQVAVGQGLERRDRRADVATAAVLPREAHAGLAGGRHREHELLDPLAEVGPRHGLGVLEHGRVLGEVGADQSPGVGVPAVEKAGQLGDVEVGRHGETVPTSRARLRLRDGRRSWA